MQYIHSESGSKATRMYVYTRRHNTARAPATFPQQPVPRDGRLRSNLCSVSETQLNFKTICKHLRRPPPPPGVFPKRPTSIFVSKLRHTYIIICVYFVRVCACVSSMCLFARTTRIIILLRRRRQKPNNVIICTCINDAV